MGWGGVDYLNGFKQLWRSLTHINRRGEGGGGRGRSRPGGAAGQLGGEHQGAQWRMPGARGPLLGAGCMGRGRGIAGRRAPPNPAGRPVAAAGLPAAAPAPRPLTCMRSTAGGSPRADTPTRHSGGRSRKANTWRPALRRRASEQAAWERLPERLLCWPCRHVPALPRAIHGMLPLPRLACPAQLRPPEPHLTCFNEWPLLCATDRIASAVAISPARRASSPR